MEYEIFCPDCGTFVESGDSRDSIVRDLECPECGAIFDFSEDEELDNGWVEDDEEIPYNELDDSN